MSDSDRLADHGQAPDFRDIALWLNSEPLSLADLRGNVVLIDFWTYSCVNCLRTLPHLKRWHETYRDAGLVIVGVHSPEFAFGREADNVSDAVADLDVQYAVALDNDFSTWQAWGNQFWPAQYFIDKRGHVRFFHFGEGAYEESEEVIRVLLAEDADTGDLPDRAVSEIEEPSPRERRTPELYLGYERLANYVGGPITPDEQATYSMAETLPLDGLTFGGRWTVEAERSVAGAEASLQLRFQGGAVHLVLGNGSEPKTVEVFLDGEPRGAIKVTDYELYTLAETGDMRADPALLQKDHLLELRFSPGTEAYAFTFGVL